MDRKERLRRNDDAAMGSSRHDVHCGIDLRLILSQRLLRRDPYVARRALNRSPPLWAGGIRRILKYCHPFRSWGDFLQQLDKFSADRELHEHETRGVPAGAGKASDKSLPDWVGDCHKNQRDRARRFTHRRERRTVSKDSVRLRFHQLLCIGTTSSVIALAQRTSILRLPPSCQPSAAS